MKKKRNMFFRIFVYLLLCIIGCLIYFYVTSRMLTVSYYEVEASIDNQIRIVQLSDLHNAEFGKNNYKLIELVEMQEPDLIVMTGDMLNRDNENLDIVINLISQLNKIAPVYFGYGNHESSWETTWNRELHEELSNKGAVVLNNEYIDVNINGNEIRLGGYMGYYQAPHMLTNDEEQIELEQSFCKEFQDTDRYKILLNHIPTQWVDWGYIEKYNVDLVLSGHYHGGMIRIPIIDRGVYAPYVGWMPTYTKGMYVGTEATCVLSAGLGTEYLIPRINNLSEIVVVDLEGAYGEKRY